LSLTSKHCSCSLHVCVRSWWSKRQQFFYSSDFRLHIKVRIIL